LSYIDQIRKTRYVIINEEQRYEFMSFSHLILHRTEHVLN